MLPRSKPRVRVAPRAVSSDVEDAAFLSGGYGLTPDDWQEDVLDDWLGRRRDGRWASATCGLAVPRQNGKNGVIEIRELFGMVALGEKFLHTAHEVKTARKAFLRLASFFENVRQYPELAALVKEIRKTNGQEAIVLTTGGSCEFIARSKGSGRGFTVDVLVCDEAQDLNDEALAALLPTISAAPSGNPQVILTGTPPDPEKGQTGEVFTRVRGDGESRRDKRLAWTDFGVPDGSLPDIDNRVLWAECNPTLGIRLAGAEIVRERGLMSPETFARERLGWWGDPAAASSQAFGEGKWSACAVPGLEPVVGALGAAVSWDRRHASVGVAGVDAGSAVVGALTRRPGVGWIVPELKRLQEQYGCPVVVDGKGPIADLIPAMQAANIDLTVLGTPDILDAWAGIYDRVQDGTLGHPAQADLDNAVAVAAKRDVNGRWTWARKTSLADISTLEAVTNALHVAQQGPSDPSVYFL